METKKHRNTNPSLGLAKTHAMWSVSVKTSHRFIKDLDFHSTGKVSTFANMVFPVPGGPYNSTPLQTWASRRGAYTSTHMRTYTHLTHIIIIMFKLLWDTCIKHEEERRVMLVIRVFCHVSLPCIKTLPMRFSFCMFSRIRWENRFCLTYITNKQTNIHTYIHFLFVNFM